MAGCVKNTGIRTILLDSRVWLTRTTPTDANGHLGVNLSE